MAARKATTAKRPASAPLAPAARKLLKSLTGQTFDSFANFLAHVGRNTGNQGDGSHYQYSPLSRNRLQMEYAYRSSWIAGRVVDVIADDMTREGVTVTSSVHPDKLSQLDKEVQRLQLWKGLNETVKWARLYGGAGAFLMVDGQDPATPLRLETLRKGQFRGLLPMDRWLLLPSLQDLVTDYGPSFGKPMYYDTVPDSMGMPNLHIHHSRMLRVDAVVLPYWQRISENLWGQSALERLWDRLIAFDSTTQGVAQLVYKAHLRTYKVDDLRKLIAQGGQALKGLEQQMNAVRVFQSNEGLTLMDAKDDFETHQYAFSGLDAVLASFGEQLAGASETPLTKLFGQSPAGFNTGEADIQNYDDSIRQKQVSTIGPQVEILYRIAYINRFGTEPPDVFDIDFKSMRALTDLQKADVTAKNTDSIVKANDSGLVKRSTALKELKASSKITGIWATINDEEINEAENDPPPSPESLGLEVPEKPAPVIAAPGQQTPPNQDE